MAYPKFGTYQAVVTDNSEFYKRGYIRVRISAFFNGSVQWDLSQTYNEKEFKSALKDDIKCLVYMPVGGGNGHGMFTLPQVNSVGIVNFIDGNIKKALWMGSFVNPKYDVNGDFYGANVPNDKLDYEGAGTEGITVDGKQVDVEGGAIIIRQKSTTNGNAKEMNWDENRTENLIVVGKNKLTMTHASVWKEEDYSTSPKEYQEISIETESDESSIDYGKTVITVKDISITDDSLVDEYGLEIAEKKVTLKTSSSSAKMINKIEVDESEISLTSTDTNTSRTTNASISPDEILLNNKDSNVLLTRSEVNISSKSKVTLSADQVFIGGLGEEHVVTASIPFSYRMEDGTVLSASHKVKA